MSDYANAFNEGINNARRSLVANREIDEVIKAFKDQIGKLSEHKIIIDCGHLSASLGIHGAAGHPSYGPHPLSLVIPARSGIGKPRILASAADDAGKQSVELASLEIGQWGYPCTLAWENEERQCMDRKALERALADMLKDPVVATKLLSLMEVTTTEPLAVREDAKPYKAKS